MDAVHIRSYKEEDFDDLLRIYTSAKKSADCYSGEEVRSDDLRELIRGEDNLVAAYGKRLVGFVSVWVPDNFIHHLYVSPDHQSRGIGNALINTCKTKFGLPLYLKCDRCNIKALNYYKKHGWTKISEGVGEHGLWEKLRLGDVEL